MSPAGVCTVVDVTLISAICTMTGPGCIATPDCTGTPDCMGTPVCTGTVGTVPCTGTVGSGTESGAGTLHGSLGEDVMNATLVLPALRRELARHRGVVARRRRGHAYPAGGAATVGLLDA